VLNSAADSLSTSSGAQLGGGQLVNELGH
jgi:hypothetical protein